MGQFHDRRFPGETDAYRKSRDQLIEAEVALRRQVEAVAKMRRSLPLGGKLKEDYIFDEGGIDLANRTTIKQTRFSEIFEGGKNSLVIYNFMFAPGAKAPCPMCTSFLDSLNGAAPHIRQRVNLAVVAKASITELRDFARGRGWNEHRLLSSKNNRFNADYHGERSALDQAPVMHVFEKVGVDIHHAYCTELNFLKPDPGQNQRHIDMMWPLWNVLDLVREGRGTDWFPSLSYTSERASTAKSA
jgi:predicted dithiol-disulfide oxidoreductase (DUF899 family)